MSGPEESGPVELVRALATLAEAPAPEHGRLAELLELPDAPDAAAHAELFSYQVYPYASVFLGDEGMLGGEVRDRIAGFWRALNMDVPEEPDHLVPLLGLWCVLRERAASEQEPARARLAGEAAAALWFEHLLPWLPQFLESVRGVEQAAGREKGFYAAWAELLSRAIGGAPSGDRGLPVHLRAASGLSDPSEAGGEAFLDAILTPVRSGMILSRADLTRLAADLELGGRIAERKYALRSFLSQDPSRVFDWLASEAERWSKRHRSPDPRVEAFWVDRAQRSATAFHAAADTAREWVTS